MVACGCSQTDELILVSNACSNLSFSFPLAFSVTIPLNALGRVISSQVVVHSFTKSFLLVVIKTACALLLLSINS